MANQDPLNLQVPLDDSTKHFENLKLFSEVRKLVPQYKTRQDAIHGIAKELETLAANSNKTVEVFLEEAHTTVITQEQHRLALRMERQLAHLRR